MATHARQQYFADESSLSKEKREFSIADEIQEKIDSVEEGAQVNKIETVKVNGTALVPDANKAVNVDVPEVIDNLYTVAADDALSAKQGKLLYDYIQNLQTIGRFLSNWDSTTGLPITNPSESPYLYKAGDYYRVSNVAVSPALNYKPDGSSFIIGQASTTVETNNVNISDLYLYDGTTWILLSNSGSSIAVDSSLSTTSTNPVENRVITNALNGKHPGEISNVAPSNPVEGMLWYDTVNDELKTYNGTSWETEGTKMVVLEYGVSTWQDFIDAYNENAIVYCKVTSGGTGYRMAFMAYTAGQGTPTEVEFQYYRSRSSHSQSSTQLDEVYVYKLTNAGVWTTTQRDTGAEMIAGTGIGITFNSSGATINNTGVTSVNGDTGAVTVQATLVSGTNIKTVNNESLLGSGNITTPDTTYTAGTGISIIEQDYSAIQGPCPDGYHIPTSDEWTAIKTAWLNLGGGEYDGNDFGMYLKLPYAGYRAEINAYPTLQTMMGEYRSVTVNGNNIRRLAFNEDGGIYTNGSTHRSRALSIRPFKDIPVVPDSSWTTLYSGSGDAGIFYNSTLGLISISSDGTNWITIADKNLGATTAWNSGDTLSETNCGKYYQWGNNYGFPFTGNVTTSSSTVDTTGYGPGNYYSSSTFITTSASPNDWSNPKNDNLRGGETGVLTNSITNTGVTSVNGSTGAVTVSEFTATSGGVKVFTFPSVNDDITDLVTWLNSGGDAILKDSNSYCRVTMNDSVNKEIRAIKEAGSSRDERVIEYDSSKIVTSILATERKYFAPDNAGSIGDVLTKKVGGYEWGAPTWGDKIEYVTQAEYTALLPGAESDGKHYFIYSTSGGGGGWTPGANTVAYYPLDTDFNDASGNSRNLTNTNVTITTQGGVSCAYFDGSSYAEYIGYSLSNTGRTVLGWCYIPNDNTAKAFIHISNSSTQYPTGSLGGNFGGTTFNVSDWVANYNNGTFTPNQWFLLTITQAGASETLYINGVQVSTKSDYPSEGTSPDGWCLGAKFWSSHSEKLTGYLSNIILEDKERTGQEISDYFDLTKGDYGIS